MNFLLLEARWTELFDYSRGWAGREEFVRIFDRGNGEYGCIT